MSLLLFIIFTNEWFNSNAYMSTNMDMCWGVFACLNKNWFCALTDQALCIALGKTLWKLACLLE